MANSLTEICPLSAINDPKSFEKKTSISVATRRNKFNNRKDLILTPKFKYQANFAAKDIEQIRMLLKLERTNLDEADLKFWDPDYERMMKDDWLVTRFLLRGRKAGQKQQVNATNKDAVSTAIYVHTMDLIKSCAKFRRDYRINGLTSESEFPKEWLDTNGLFNYKPDLVGNPVIYLRIKVHKPKLIESKEMRHEFKRLLLYTLEKCDQDLLDNPGKGICCLFDMSDATFENVDLEIVSWMIKSFKSCSPKLLCYVIVYNLPWFFSATFKLISNTLMSNSNKQCLKFVYGNEILSYIDRDNLPMYIRAGV